MVRRLTGRWFAPAAGLVVCSLAGCPNLDQLGPGIARPSDGGDASHLEGGIEPEADSGLYLPAEGDLIGAWDFDGTGNVAEDLSRNNHLAELSGEATQEAGAGVRGGALVLHGLDNARVASLQGDAFPRTGTLALWLRYTEGPDDFGVFDNFDDARVHLFVRHRPGDEGRLQVAFQTPTATDGYEWSTFVPAPGETWIHIAVSWDEAEQHARLWLNGVLHEEGAFKASFAFGDEQRFLLGDRMKGAIDEVRIYRVVLSDAQIKELAKR